MTTLSYSTRVSSLEKKFKRYTQIKYVFFFLDSTLLVFFAILLNIDGQKEPIHYSSMSQVNRSSYTGKTVYTPLLRPASDDDSPTYIIAPSGRKGYFPVKSLCDLMICNCIKEKIDCNCESEETVSH